MTKKRLTIIILSLGLTIVGFGCVALSKYATPADKSDTAVQYAVKTGIAEPNDYKGYFNLHKAEELVDDVDTGHVLTQQRLQQAMDRDSTEHNLAHGKAEANRQVAAKREEMLFGEKGLLSLGLTMAGFGSFTGLLGLMRKRPGDLTKEETDKLLADVTGKTTEQLNTKDRQFVQLVKGIKEFAETYQGQDAVDTLKAIMNDVQDTETKVAVASLKKNGSV